MKTEYKPFDLKSFIPQSMRWFTSILKSNSIDPYYRAYAISKTGILFISSFSPEHTRCLDWERLLKDYKFVDDNSPCGVKKEN